MRLAFGIHFISLHGYRSSVGIHERIFRRAQVQGRQVRDERDRDVFRDLVFSPPPHPPPPPIMVFSP